MTEKANLALREVSVKVSSGHIYKGYFHCWCKEPFYTDGDKYVDRTFAIVELPTGSIQLVEPISLTFSNPAKSNE